MFAPTSLPIFSFSSVLLSTMWTVQTHQSPFTFSQTINLFCCLLVVSFTFPFVFVSLTLNLIRQICPGTIYMYTNILPFLHNLHSAASVVWSGGALGPGGIPAVTVKKWRLSTDAGTWRLPRWWPEGGAGGEGVSHSSTLRPWGWVGRRMSDTDRRRIHTQKSLR